MTQVNIFVLIETRQLDLDNYNLSDWHKFHVALYPMHESFSSTSSLKLISSITHDMLITDPCIG